MAQQPMVSTDGVKLPSGANGKVTARGAAKETSGHRATAHHKPQRKRRHCTPRFTLLRLYSRAGCGLGLAGLWRWRWSW